MYFELVAAMRLMECFCIFFLQGADPDQPLGPDQFHEVLKDGIILCRFVILLLYVGGDTFRHVSRQTFEELWIGKFLLKNVEKNTTCSQAPCIYYLHFLWGGPFCGLCVMEIIRIYNIPTLEFLYCNIWKKIIEWSTSSKFCQISVILLKWYSGLKNYLEVDNYNAALRWYTCTHNVYSLFNYPTVKVRWQQCCCHLCCHLCSHCLFPRTQK